MSKFKSSKIGHTDFLENNIRQLYNISPLDAEIWFLLFSSQSMTFSSTVFLLMHLLYEA